MQLKYKKAVLGKHASYFPIRLLRPSCFFKIYLLFLQYSLARIAKTQNDKQTP